MYEAFFGLRERPFQLTPNPRFLFLNPAHREALATLRYGLTSSLGITLLVGEAGTGKTTLLSAALNAERRPEHRYAVLSNPTLAPADFYEMLADRFGLPYNSGAKGRFLLAFERDLLERHAAGGLTALVIDEAQSLSHDLFEEVRLLANIETPTAKLLNVILIGQRELAARLSDPNLRQFRQRIVLRCSLPPLDLEWTASYISARLRVAGAAAGDVFTKDAVSTIYEASHGIPRTIGVICENALLAGYASQRKPVDRSIVADVCRDLDLPVKGRPPREDGVLTVQDVAVPKPPVPAEPEPRRAASRFWFSPRSKESRPESAEDDSAAPMVKDHTRMFRFF